MESLPFEASFETLSLMAKWLRQGVGDDGLVPVLDRCFNASMFTAKEIIQSIPYEHFTVIWCSPEDKDEYQEINVLGWRLLIHPLTLERLSGKRLVVKNTRTSHPDDPSVYTHVLVAVPKLIPS